MANIKRIYIFGASGSGTTTLGRDLAANLGYPQFDADRYFWLPTNPPFQQKRELEARVSLLANDLTGNEQWILSGSMTGWGDRFVPLFDLAVYLSIPPEVRLARLKAREARTFGEKEIQPGGKWHDHFNEFIAWASQYDEGGMEVRSKALHEKWMQSFRCSILRIEGDVSREERVRRVLRVLKT